MSARRAAKSLPENTTTAKAKSAVAKANHDKPKSKVALVREIPHEIAKEIDDPIIADDLVLPAASDEEGDSVLHREDPQQDRRIIEGMLRDREALFAELAGLGVGKNAVLRRAAELGLSEALIRQLRGVAADLAGDRQAGRRPVPSSLGARTCLSCDRVFLSSGPGNRLCMRCRGGDAGLAQL